jgi:hypothetical protein
VFYNTGYRSCFPPGDRTYYRGYRSRFSGGLACYPGYRSCFPWPCLFSGNRSCFLYHCFLFYLQVIVMLVAILIVFTVCWMPIQIILLYSELRTNRNMVSNNTNVIES